MIVAPPARLVAADFTLRPWSVDDASAFAAALAASEAHLLAWTPWVLDGRVPGLSIEERLRRHGVAFADGTEWVYGMFGANDIDVLGGCGLYPRVGPAAVELGYWLSAAQTGRGLATAATALLTRVAFASPEIERVEIRCDPRNEPSNRIPRRLGYTRDAHADAGGAGHHGLTIWRLTRAAFVERGATNP